MSFEYEPTTFFTPKNPGRALPYIMDRRIVTEISAVTVAPSAFDARQKYRKRKTTVYSPVSRHSTDSVCSSQYLAAAQLRGGSCFRPVHHRTSQLRSTLTDTQLSKLCFHYLWKSGQMLIMAGHTAVEYNCKKIHDQ